MSALVVAHSGRAAVYGAEELKQAAHRYMFVALSLSILIHFSIIGSYYFSAIFRNATVPPGTPYLPGPSVTLTPNPTIPGIVELPPLPSRTVPKVVQAGTPTPVPDAPEVMEKSIPSQPEFREIVDPHGSEMPSVVSGKLPVVIDDARPPDTFFVVEKLPVLVKSVVPVYPPLALKAELEGKVFVKMWVDRQGKVREVRVVKSDNEIFDDVAVEAAKQFVFTPAYMNSGPVSVWVAFPFRFRLSATK